MSWEKNLEETYYKKGIFKHGSPSLISIFPYTTSPITQDILDEMKSFSAITGEALRDLAMIDNDVDCTPSSIISNIKDKVQTDNLSDLQHIVRITLFDKNDQIHCFHPSIFYHLPKKRSAKALSSLAHYTRDILLGDNKSLGPDYPTEGSSTNVFHSLILKNLPPLNSKKSKRKKTYYKIPDSIFDCFVQDCTFLKQDSKLYASHLPELLKLYFFIYQLRIIENLNNLFQHSDNQPFFFTVYWENLSKSRQAYLGGWKRINSKYLSMWSHANCLEMLNHIPFEGLVSPFTYSDIKIWTKQATSEEKQNAIEKVNLLINFYKKGIEGLNFDWSKYPNLACNTNEEELENRIESFFKMVLCQFTHSSRKAASKRYAKWIYQFAISNYFKPRGPLGNTLCLSRSQLLLITRLCIGDHPDQKLRLIELWKEFSKRGIAFDFETQKHILILFNKLNLIEKKSDSGDAQYVRAIF